MTPHIASREARRHFGEADGIDEREVNVMFHALYLLAPEHEWRAYDWSILIGPADERVEYMLLWRVVYEAALRDLYPNQGSRQILGAAASDEANQTCQWGAAVAKAQSSPVGSQAGEPGAAP